MNASERTFSQISKKTKTKKNTQHPKHWLVTFVNEALVRTEQLGAVDTVGSPSSSHNHNPGPQEGTDSASPHLQTTDAK